MTATHLRIEVDQLGDIAKRIHSEWAEIKRVLKSGIARAVTIGKLLMQVKGQLDHGELIPWIEEHCPFGERQAQKFMRLATRASELPNTNSNSHLSIDEAVRMLAAPKDAPHVTHNSGDTEWYTPELCIRAATGVMGAIDLDPASTRAANEVVKARQFFTVADDGLSKKWKGRVWLNPPYGSNLIRKFIEKLCKSFDSGDVTEAIVLVNNATETRWFYELGSHASAAVFPIGRVKFWHTDTNKGSTPLQGQAVVYLGVHSDRFVNLFGGFGLAFVPAKAGAA